MLDINVLVHVLYMYEYLLVTGYRFVACTSSILKYVLYVLLYEQVQ